MESSSESELQHQDFLPCCQLQTWYYQPAGRMRTPPEPAEDFHDSSLDEPGPSAT